MTSLLAQLCLKSPASRLLTQPFVQPKIKENIIAPRHWPLWGEFNGDRWIPGTKDQERGKCFHWWRHQWLEHMLFIFSFMVFGEGICIILQNLVSPEHPSLWDILLRARRMIPCSMQISAIILCLWKKLYADGILCEFRITPAGDD